ncbi:serine-rich adhesin for platelets [Antennarius striatus]|uniref:serine-rich adhesin for platelets n=1 Tax=Antennarius striatus TaxID=241820 RepID=UPI0035B43220
MKPLKPVYMKTYGKQRRRLSAWISPDDRKQAFDSSRSTDGDASVFESSKPVKGVRISTAAHRRVLRPAKAKAMLCLSEMSFGESNIPATGCIQADQQIKKKSLRNKKRSVSSDKTAPPSRRKALLHLTKTSSDEENISRSSSAQNIQLRKKPRVLMRQKGQKFPGTSESDESASTSNSLKSSRTDSTVNRRSASRFVTRRRRVVSAQPKPSKSTSGTPNSSDDFTSGGFGPCRNLRPLRKKRLLATFETSSTENLENAVDVASFGLKPFRELSLNELADPSVALQPRTPIFCSTPSAGLLSKRPRLKLLSTTDKSAFSPSKSVSCIAGGSPFREAVHSRPQHTGLQSQENLLSSLGELEPSGDLFVSNRHACSEEAKSHDEDVMKIDEGLESLHLLSADDTEKSSRFVSAAGGSDWLMEALKEKCLTRRCSVKLKTLCSLSAAQLSAQTNYSSCLELELSRQKCIESINLSQSSEPSLGLHLSDTQKTNDTSAEHSLSEAAAVKKACLSQKCSVQFPRLRLSDAGLIYNKRSVHSSAGPSNKSDGAQITEGPEDVTCSGEAGGRRMESVRDRTNINLVSQTQLPDPKEEVKMLSAMLKKKCLNSKSEVVIEKLTLLQLKEILQHRQVKLTSDNDEQTKICLPSETRGANNRKDNACAVKVHVEKDGSAISDVRIDLGKAKVVRNCNVPDKAKRTSVAPRERKRNSVSTDRSGTSRKVCVSGLSVSRWRNKGNVSALMFRRNRTEDCSISELITTNKQTMERLDNTRIFSTPIRASRLSLSSLLADLTPDTHTWSRLKAALSVHRKVLLTPKTPRLLASGRRARDQFADVSQDLFASPFRSALPKRLRSQLHDFEVDCEDADLSDAEKVYAECGQTCPLPWEECIIPQYMKHCVKIGEGTFGEVFSTTSTSGQTVAFKIIPVEGSEQVNGEDQKTFGEILHEIIISKELSSLKEKQQNQTLGFIGLNTLHCVKGCYPPDFLKAWDRFDKLKGSENDRPDFFENDQIFIILEFEFGGKDLENSNGTLTSLVVAKSILHQVTAALAVAEQELHFEHRDLHWGNVLVKTTKQKTGSFLLNGAAHSFETKGVLVRIIDYSLSRLEIDDLTVSCDISKDDELFMGHGDYQFDIYRLMRQENGNDWSEYHPHTNVLWLHYLCSKLLSMKYRQPGGRAAKDTREALTRFYDNVLQCSSATEALQNCPMFQ